MKNFVAMILIVLNATSTFAANQCSGVMVSLEEKIEKKAQPFLDEGYYLMGFEPSAAQGYYILDFYHPFQGDQGRGKTLRKRFLIN